MLAVRSPGRCSINLVKRIRLTRYRPTVKVTTRTPKQASDYQRHRQWATRQKKHNKIDYYNVPLDRDTQYLLGITDADRQNKKAVGEAIGEVIGEMMMVLLDLQLQLGLTDKKNDKLAINKVRLAVRGKRYPHRGSIIPESGDIIER